MHFVYLRFFYLISHLSGNAFAQIAYFNQIIYLIDTGMLGCATALDVMI